MMSEMTLKNLQDHSVISIVGDAAHSEKVLDWRKDQFVRMGFADYLADYLASTRIDIWQMRDLIEKGCPPEVAPSILIGTMWSGEDPQVMWREDNDDAEEEDSDSSASELAAS